MNKVYFRADASQTIGYGHFIRSLALADMLRNDFECTIFTQSPTPAQIRQAEGICPVKGLPDDDSRFGIFLDMLDGTETVVLDNYFYTSGYQRRIMEKGCRLVCIDDMHNLHYHADAVINHGFVRPDDFSCDAHTRLCLGPDWALLRRPFLNAVRTERSSRESMKVAVCFGGGDPLGLTGKFSRLLEGSPEVSEVRTVNGMSGGLTATEMAELFTWCDAALVSMSSVCLEALACGARVAAGWYVDNQEEGYRNFTSRGLIYGLGDLSQGIPSGEETIRALEEAPDAGNLIDGNAIRERFIRLFNTIQ